MSACRVVFVVVAVSLGLSRGVQADTLDRIYVIVKGTQGSGVDLLMSHVPEAKRAQSRALFDKLLTRYRGLEHKTGLRTDDPAGAIAIFVAGNMAAYRHVEMPDAGFSALIAQIRAGGPRVFAASEANRVSVAQQYEIIGTLMWISQEDLAAHPNPALAGALENSARNYLHAMLDLDVDRIELGEHGLAWTHGDPGGVLASVGTRPAAAAPPPAPEPARTPSGATPKIEAVVFRTATQMSVGGSLAFMPTPTVLFANGDALLDMTGLVDPGGVDANKRAKPGNWTRWRSAGGSIETQNKRGGWDRLSFKTKYGPLPAGFRLAAAYQSLGGGGDTAVGGGTMIATWRNLRFDRSGAFSTGGGVSASSRGHGTSVATGSKAAPQSGTYEIAGYTLTLHFADGHTQVRSIVVTDPKSPTAIWVDGTGYSSK